MLHKLLIQILAFIFAIMLSIFAIGTILTASAPTAVGVLITDFPVESVQIPDTDGPTVHGWLVYGKPGNGVVLLVHSMRSNRLEMLSRARFLKAVSYTHLDVYKRQVLSCAPEMISTPCSPFPTRSCPVADVPM